MDTTGRFWMQRELKRSLETKFDRIYGKCEVELNAGGKNGKNGWLGEFRAGLRKAGQERVVVAAGCGGER
ncbi:hypothetical protein CAMRE0001_0143 [Campylobacter rectus RM3267]|uniref:Uncharacterized protein n=2 Tax=Campylobacter rectus TaxID=203 RepID=A0A6G5QJR9_CAMRE|nr:hypothetical protein CAMRE0001_0143 [Campylobacter rectus RM3267]QCD45827.1 hypothetical protein CRECT_0118 [Campylobacter rectus]